MFQLPFHDGRSFALYLKERARNKGLSMYQVFEKGVIDENCFYKYMANKREPKISTVVNILVKIESFSTEKSLHCAA